MGNIHTLEQYQTGFAAREAGALPGFDLTLSAATQKLMYALGREGDFETHFYEKIGRDME